MCMPSLGGKFLHVNASTPSSKWMVIHAISSNEMTAEEEERGHQLQLARLKKNEKQPKRNCRTAGERMKPENVCLTVADGCKGEKVAAVKQCKRNRWTAG
jgi:hypothetical protein